jgi:glycosyltransferase involved in cell wall biosynthesis
LPNTIDDAFYSAVSPGGKCAARELLQLSATAIVLVAVARLVDFKGIPELVDGYLGLSDDEKRRCHLVILGDGPLRESLTRKLVSTGTTTVFLPGHVDAEQLRQYLSAADAFILPSKIDPNPLSAIEAAFAGKPLIISKYAGNVDDLVQEGNNGWVLEEVTAGCIAQAMRTFLAINEEQRYLMGKRSHEIATAGFRREVVAESLVEQLLRSFPIGH